MENLVTLLSEPSAWMALFTLIVMEVVLGIDNLIFVSILTNKLPEAQRPKARVIGLSLALIFRLALLGTVAIIVQLVEPVITLLDHSFSWRDIILITGGLFLVWKATKEIHHSVDPGDDDADAKNVVVSSFATVIGQILVLDLVFSIDSIITAVGMTDHISIMVIAVVTAVIAMLLAAGPLSRFIEANPTIVMLALGFLLMIGMTLIADGFGVHVPKGYIYAAMAFSAFVELLNMLSRKRRKKKASQA
ncbi:TerC family protein [Kiloniella majae]|uniref:TerC family protein n=1 Tax=Kiloniella majae TaxID=1938558 RepID=UPI000A277997|nr:TerC family protein [Kiloniella majae]